MPAPSRARRLTLVAAVTLLLPACASAPAASPFDPPASHPEGLDIAVVNDHVMDMRIYLLRGSVPMPVGSIGSAERRVFHLSPSELGNMGAIRLVAEPLGGHENRLSLSSITVRL